MVARRIGSRSVGMGILFYPRGGSAQVVRYLSRALETTGWETVVATGSLGGSDETGHAPTFFDRRDLVIADFTEARAWHRAGCDPLEAPMPFHPSYEDRSGVPDRSFARVAPEQAKRQVAAWRLLLADPRWSGTTIAHVHHLGPLQEALAPDRVLVSHLHGTELKFIDAVRRGDESGPHGPWWADRMVAAARGSDLLVCISEHDRNLATELLGVDPDRVTVMPNGVDVERFVPRRLAPTDRRAAWRRWLVEDPRGWDTTGEPGSVRYREDDLVAFGPVDDPHPVLLFTGRFLGFKRVPLLIRAYARARARMAVPAPLVVWGGSPGEWEGEHPVDVARAEGVADSVFFVGWRGHDELPLGLAAADVMVGPSVDEPFGQVFLEAMATGRPAITTATGGPLAFVQPSGPEANGWLVAPDDVDALAAAIIEAVDDGPGRTARGAAGRRLVERHFSWRSIAARMADRYDDLLDAPHRSPAVSPY
jgi:D-inositol-3-phosphate glycosyltransferase